MDMSTRMAMPDCPEWCAVRHRAPQEVDHVHLGGTLLVRDTELRLLSTIDSTANTQDGPYVLVGDAEFTLHEAEALLAALTQLVNQAQASLPTQQPDGALTVVDSQLAQRARHVHPHRGRGDE